MSLQIDNVTNKSFRKNLLLGLSSKLRRTPGVTNVRTVTYPPCSSHDVRTWEEIHGVRLPEDVRNFYTSTNGLTHRWRYAASDDDVQTHDSIGACPLSRLVQLVGYVVQRQSSVTIRNNRYRLRLGPTARVFVLRAVETNALVCLVYLKHDRLPTVWLMDGPSFYYLAADFTTYLRMCIAHMGLPAWQLGYTTRGLPPYAEQLFRIVAPHLLPFGAAVEDPEGHTLDDCL